jgi:hypothetical protein
LRGAAPEVLDPELIHYVYGNWLSLCGGNKNILPPMDADKRG